MRKFTHLDALDHEALDHEALDVEAPGVDDDTRADDAPTRHDTGDRSACRREGDLVGVVRCVGVRGRRGSGRPARRTGWHRVLTGRIRP